MNFSLKNWVRLLMMVLMVGFVACTEDGVSTVGDCSADADCGEHGLYCEDGTCICETGWYGPNCEQYDCVISGLGCVNGNCLEDGSCECEEGWYGADCSSQTPETVDCADLDCGENATGCEDGVCVCADGYFGENCESQDACFDVVCGDNGVAVASDDGTTCACECLTGYTGENCDQLISDLFLGTYSVVSSCDDNAFISEITEQTEGGIAVAGKVKVTNFSNLEFTTDTGVVVDLNIVADVVDDTELSIFALFNGAEIIGTGSFTDATYETILFSYTITYPNGQADTCTDTYTRQ